MSGIDDLDLLQHAEGDAEGVLNEILIKYRERIHRMVATRMNPRLQGRLDASDIVQDAYIEASRALDGYLANPQMPVFLWLRRLAGQQLIQAHRRHLDTAKRAAGQEQRILGGAPSATSQCIAVQLLGRLPSPSQQAVRNESKARLLTALEEMGELDREVLMLRHFEQLSGPEAAAVLGISHDAIKKRYIRALDRLQVILQAELS